MAANPTFYSILHQVQTSNLNFKIEMTPFAASIILKKTVFKDKNGIAAIPSPPINLLLQQAEHQIFNLQNYIATLKETVEKLESNADESNKVIHDLSLKLEKSNMEL